MINVCLFVLFARFVIVNLRRLSSLPPSLSYHPHDFFSSLSSPITCYGTSPSLGRTLYIRWSSPLSLVSLVSLLLSLTNHLYSLIYLFASSIPSYPRLITSTGPFCCFFVVFFLTWIRISIGVWLVCLFVFVSIYFSYLVPISPSLPLPLSLFILLIPYTSPSFSLSLSSFTSDVCFRGSLRQQLTRKSGALERRRWSFFWG